MNPIFKIPFIKLYTLNDLAKKSFQLKSIKKNSIPILIIDDNDFEYEQEMRASGFDITCVQDLDDLKMAKDFNIIISDIKGVGKKLKFKYEGVGLIHELSKQYPYKLYGVYTGNNIDIEMSDLLKGVEIIPKRFEKDDWSSFLDKQVHKYVDPKTFWLILRDQLISNGVPLYDLVLMEHKYVDAIINHESDFRDLFNDNDSFIPSELKTILLSVTANIITKPLGV